MAGGGVALVKAAAEVSKLRAKDNQSHEQKLGYEIVLKALEAPARAIAENAGQEAGAVIVERIKTGKGWLGYDALRGLMRPDMIADGIVDPVKVTRLGVENACSAAAILLTTEAAIADLPEDKKENHSQAGADFGY